MDQEETKRRIAILAPVDLLQQVRTTLTARGCFGHKVLGFKNPSVPDVKHYLVATTFSDDADADADTADNRRGSEEEEVGDVAVLRRSGLEMLRGRVCVYRGSEKEDKGVSSSNRVTIADKLKVFVALHPPPPSSSETRNTADILLLDALSKGLKYDIYTPMVLLPPSTPFATDPWKSYLASLNTDARSTLFTIVADYFKVTHIAVNAPIPVAENEIRRPVGITPLYGDFGTFASTSSSSSSDRSTAFWVSTVQNGIHQTWAPIYTMFSRGNIHEKARLLSLFPKSLGHPKEEVTVVDLFVGIGYFAFSYVRAGASIVLGWDINEWSIEGCKRGAIANKWGVKFVDESWQQTIPVIASQQERLLHRDRLIIFHESNIHAPARVGKIMDIIPPIRHVNLGLLPTSRPAYEVAVQLLMINNPPVSVFVHVHENIGVHEIGEKRQEVLREFEHLINARGRTLWHVSCDHVEKVKSWAPGVFHCVLDVLVEPSK